MNRKYLIKNISKNDIILGDLRYKIPAGKVRNLYSKSSGVKFEDVEKSRTNGSIAVRLGKSLVEVYRDVPITTPAKEVSKDIILEFPQRIRTSVTMAVDDVPNENLIISEEDELLNEIMDEPEEEKEIPKAKQKKTKG